MPICPNGHRSKASDWCDRCGRSIGGAESSPASSPAAPAPAPAPGDERFDERLDERFDEICPVDGTPRTGRFCEADGYDFELGGAGRNVPSPAVETRPPALVPATTSGGGPARTPPARSAPSTRPAPTGTNWLAEVIADRDYYERVRAQAGPGAESFLFPPYAPERRIPLTGTQVRIGRRSASKGTPEIDLSEPPADPGVSHVHAVLLARPDDRWVLVDPGSTNGTTVNGGDEPVIFNLEVPLDEGDRVHVGVWTTIIMRRSQ